MMHEASRRRTRTVVLVIAALVVGIPVALAAAAAVGLVWAVTTVERLGEPRPEPVARAVGLTGTGAAGAAGEAQGGRPARVAIHLEDGVFTVVPGPPGRDVRVDGLFAESYYDLTHDVRPAADGDAPDVTIRLERSRSLLVQLVAHAMTRTEPAPNELTVTLPKGLPLALDLTLRAGESRVDLGGLSLTDLAVDLAMGDHRLDFSEPLALAPRRVRLDGGMGEIHFERLGNMRATEIEASGHMGEVVVDLGGAWPADAAADVRVNNLMGELRLRAPVGLRLAGSREGLRTAPGEPAAGGAGSAEGGVGPLLRLHVSSRMGETRLVRY